MYKKTILSLLMLATTSLMMTPAFAEKPTKSKDGKFEGIKTEKSIIDDWDRVKSNILSAYGVSSLTEVTLKEIKPLGTPGAPKSFIFQNDKHEIISIHKSPTDPSIFGRLAAEFEELTADEAKPFDDAIVISASKTDDGDHQIRISFFKESNSPSNSNAGASNVARIFDDVFMLKFPIGTEEMTNQKSGKSAVYLLRVPGEPESVLNGLAAQLDAQGVQHDRNENDGAYTTSGASPKGVVNLNVQAMPDEPGFSLANFSTSSF